MTIQENAQGLELFAQGSRRLSSLERWVARQLQLCGLVTLLFVLPTEDEARNRHLVFDIRYSSNAWSAPCDGPRSTRH